MTSFEIILAGAVGGWLWDTLKNPRKAEPVPAPKPEPPKTERQKYLERRQAWWDAEVEKARSRSHRRNAAAAQPTTTLDWVLLAAGLAGILAVGRIWAGF